MDASTQQMLENAFDYLINQQNVDPADIVLEEDIPSSTVIIKIDTLNWAAFAKNATLAEVQALLDNATP
jgi:hypothetical protein